MIDKILSFLNDAGTYALEKQSSVDFFKSKLKSDDIGSVVTEVDLEISKRFAEFIKKEFPNLDCVILDEETFNSVGKSAIDNINKSEYVFVLDPIDGTLVYSNGHPMWATAIGVFKNGRPFVGAACMPALGITIYSDEQHAYVRERDKSYKLEEFKTGQKSSPFVFFNSRITKALVKNPDVAESIKDLDLISGYSDIAKAMYVSLGRAIGYYFTHSLWDIAALLPVFDKIGVDVKGLDNGAVFDPLDSNTYDGNMETTQMYVVSRPEYYERLRSILI